jgi:hypothetical protein
VHAAAYQLARTRNSVAVTVRRRTDGVCRLNYDVERWNSKVRDGSAESRAGELVMRVATLVGLLPILLFAGCAAVPPVTQDEPPQGSAPHDGAVAGPPASGTAAPSTTNFTGKSATKAAAAGAKTVANIPASASQLLKKDPIVPEGTKQKASPSLDLTSLEKRLNETQAIDVLDKIAFRNQVDELLSQFRAFYQGELKTTLGELRRPYDLLVLKLLSLLQDNDPSLAAAVVASREAIWGILADRAKFATI